MSQFPRPLVRLSDAVERRNMRIEILPIGGNGTSLKPPVCEALDAGYRSVRLSTTRRLSARPCNVSLESTGSLEPAPAVVRRSAAMPRLMSSALTDSARLWESFRL
jgi:hypothetical protein